MKQFKYRYSFERSVKQMNHLIAKQHKEFEKKNTVFHQMHGIKPKVKSINVANVGGSHDDLGGFKAMNELHYLATHGAHDVTYASANTGGADIHLPIMKSLHNSRTTINSTIVGNAYSNGLSAPEVLTTKDGLYSSTPDNVNMAHLVVMPCSIF